MNKIRISHINICAVLKKKIELNEFLMSNNIDVMSVNETWLDPKKSFSIPGYDLVRLDRNNPSKKNGGGVCILLKKGFKFSQIDLPKTFEGEEILIIKIKNLYKDPLEELVVATYYNPPKYGKIKKDMLNWASKLSSKVIILGDLNAHHPCLLSNRSDQNGGIIFDFIEESNFILLNDDSPTHLGRGCQSSILDLAMISPALAVDFIDFRVEYKLSSDHLPLTVDLKCELSAPKNKTVEVVKWSVLEENLLAHLPPDPISELNSPEELETTVKALVSGIQAAVKASTVQMKVGFNSNYLILPKHLKALVTEKNRARKLFQKTRLKEHKTLLNSLEAKVKCEVNNFRKQSWIQFCESLNNYNTSNSKLWSKIKSLDSTRVKNTGRAPNLNTAVGKTNEPEEVATIFADRLEKVFSGEDKPEFDSDFKREVEEAPAFNVNEQSDFERIDITDTMLAIQMVRAKGAPGEDGITNKVLKRLPRPYLEQLTRIFNASFRLHYVPSCWKVATVIMLPKPLKDPNLPESYRPISLLNTLSKILERIASQRLLEFCRSNNIISVYQCGFRRHHQTKDQILRVSQAVQEGFNLDMKTGMLLVDIKGAFDTVWHQGLLYKLKRLGLPNYLGLWIENYLTDRSFQVRVQGSFSSLRPIRAGVPQGSVLGPLLFNLFFNDIADEKCTELGLFADDLSAWHRSRHLKMIEKKLQEYLDNIAQWLSRWRLQLSVEKTVFLLFNKAGKNLKNEINLFYNLDPIEHEKHPKFLGVVMDPGLSFCQHANYIKERAETRMNMLRSLRGRSWGTNIELLLTTYKALIRSLIDYAPPVTMAMCDTARKTLETIQSKTVRSITRWAPGETNKEMLQHYKIDEVLPRAHKLMNDYVGKAYKFNPLIKDLIEDYKIAPEISEGLYCKKNRKKRETILRKFSRLDNNDYASAALLKK